MAARRPILNALAPACKPSPPPFPSQRSPVPHVHPRSLRLTRHRMTAGDVAPTLAALAASGRAPPGFVLDALLEPSLELLPLCDCEDDLVTMALSLLQLNHRPNHAWQAAFFSASRRRLDRMSAPRLASLLVACASLGLHPPELWMREHCLLACRRMQELSGLQLANLAWAVSCLLPDPGVPWTVSFEVASTPRLKVRRRCRFRLCASCEGPVQPTTQPRPRARAIWLGKRHGPAARGVFCACGAWTCACPLGIVLLHDVVVAGWIGCKRVHAPGASLATSFCLRLVIETCRSHVQHVRRVCSTCRSWGRTRWLWRSRRCRRCTTGRPRCVAGVFGCLTSVWAGKARHAQSSQGRSPPEFMHVWVGGAKTSSCRRRAGDGVACDTIVM